MRKCSFAIGLPLLTVSTTAEAYIGPGVSAGAVAVVIAIITSVFLAFIAILWYPLKRLFRKGKVAPGNAAQERGAPAKAGSKDR